MADNDVADLCRAAESLLAAGDRAISVLRNRCSREALDLRESLDGLREAYRRTQAAVEDALGHEQRYALLARLERVRKWANGDEAVRREDAGYRDAMDDVLALLAEEVR